MTRTAVSISAAAVMAPDAMARARAALRHVTVTPVTPFTATGDIDCDGLCRNAAFLARSDVHSVALAGNTGEFHALEEDEVRRLVALWRASAGPSTFLWVGVSYALASVRRRMETAAAEGADGLLLHSPPHTYVSGGGLRAYLEQALDEAVRVHLPVAVYKRDPRMPDAVLAALAGHPALAGVKYAVNDLASVADLVARVGDGPVVACGTAEVWAVAYAAVGAQGFTSGLAGVAPALSTRLAAAIEAGDLRRARELVRLVAPFERMRQEGASALNVPVVKAAMTRRGLAGGRVRAPLEDLDEAHGAILDGILDRWQAAGAWR